MIGFWNVRGLNSLTKQKHIKWFLHHHDIGLFGLLETKVKPTSLNQIRQNICDGWCISTNSHCHKGGRVWLLWKPHMFQIHFIEYNAQFIHVCVDELATGESYHLTMVYAFNGVQERKILWLKLEQFSNQIRGPWLLCGDFNTVLRPSERLGGQTTDEEMEDFQHCVDHCNVLDMPATGSYFTWNNKQEANTRVYSRLDRALVNHEWVMKKPDYAAHFHVEGYFDHTPCIIQDTKFGSRSRKSFKFFNMWSGVDDFLPCVSKVWDCPIYGTPMFCFVRRLKLLKKPLKALNSALFEDVENNAIRARKHLEYVQEQLRRDPGNVALMDTEKQAAKDFQELQKACDSFLLQKSKATWLKEGDSNSSYFHSCIKGRQARNKIFRVADDRGCGPIWPDSTSLLEILSRFTGTEDSVKRLMFRWCKKALFVLLNIGISCWHLFLMWR
ncbi:uncharacterized protein LOC141617471 [Silene latifolia]|uniref:uncharacterized protein LOC141617471 n=1 Tax=Silene latifolia TaxID=37657 RepID=UPI003D770066